MGNVSKKCTCPYVWEGQEGDRESELQGRGNSKNHLITSGKLEFISIYIEVTSGYGMYTYVDFTSQIVEHKRVPCPTNKGVTVTLKIDYYYIKNYIKLNN